METYVTSDSEYSAVYLYPYLFKVKCTFVSHNYLTNGEATIFCAYKPMSIMIKIYNLIRITTYELNPCRDSQHTSLDTTEVEIVPPLLWTS